MKNYLAVFIGSESSPNAAKWDALDKKTRDQREKAGMDAWGKWMETHKKLIVTMGSPLGATKAVGPKGITDTTNNLTAWVEVRAETHEAAARMFLEHPHFSIFPGDSIEIMECLPIPGQ